MLDDEDNIFIRTFRALCESRALRWRIGEWEWIGEAVDPLPAWAAAHGIEEDAAQQIIAEAFK